MLMDISHHHICMLSNFIKNRIYVIVSKDNTVPGVIDIIFLDLTFTTAFVQLLWQKLIIIKINLGAILISCKNMTTV